MSYTNYLSVISHSKNEDWEGLKSKFSSSHKNNWTEMKRFKITVYLIYHGFGKQYQVSAWMAKQVILNIGYSFQRLSTFINQVLTKKEFQ